MLEKYIAQARNSTDADLSEFEARKAEQEERAKQAQGKKPKK